MKYDAVVPQGEDQSQPAENQPSGGEESPETIFLAGASVVALIALVAIVVGINSIARRSPKRNPIYQHEPLPMINPPPPAAIPMMPVHNTSPPPPPPMVPPLPPGGLPPGWTMEQWYYYGEEYLDKFYSGANFRDR